ncbi:MAG: RelA/SpoT family protein [Ruminococcus sp.]|nr:RelA/SpoT family protein [Ruminococcus sp.]
MDSGNTQKKVLVDDNSVIDIVPISIRNYNDDFTIDMIIQKIMDDDVQYDLSKIISAYNFAKKAHEGQKRSSGQPYITHPLAVAYITLELKMDTDAICSALLHDVIEDTDTTFEDLRRNFGLDIALIVDSVSKMKRMNDMTKSEQQAEAIVKILTATSRDIRVIIVKLADRLHNMRTLKYCSPDKQKRIAYETKNVYIPIARRLGMNELKDQFEDLAFFYISPSSYIEIEERLNSDLKERNEFIESTKNNIENMLVHTGHYSEKPFVQGRVKSIFGIWNKIYKKQKNFEEIYDRYALRVIVNTREECFIAMSDIIKDYPSILSRTKNYIDNPKSNGYQSIHLTVLSPDGVTFEVQIRTWEMHRVAEYGLAAHWKYKSLINSDSKAGKDLSWISRIMEACESSNDPETIISVINTELSPDNISIITPKAKRIMLPIGANPIDFAYKIHTEVGHKAIQAKVNNRLVPLSYELHHDDICEIITSKDPNKGPSRDWLQIAKTNYAQSRIRTWFKNERREENIREGRTRLEIEFRKNGINVPEAKYSEFLGNDIKKHNCDTLDDFYASVGYGGIQLVSIIPRLKDKYNKMYGTGNVHTAPVTVTGNNIHDGIILDDVNGINYKCAQCCNPLPGDNIVGYITRGYGLSIHNTECINYVSAVRRNIPEELERWVKVSWNAEKPVRLHTSFEVIAVDRVGLVHDITELLYDARIPIVHSSSRTLKNGNALFESTIIISNIEQLKRLFEKIRKISGVISAERSSNKEEK